MTENQNNSHFGRLLRDTAIVVTGLTALAFFFGYDHEYQYWRFVGLNRAVRPESPVEVILLRGGTSVFLTALLVYVVMCAHKAFPGRGTGGRLPSSLLRQTNVKMACLLALLITTMLMNRAFAWRRSIQFEKEMARVTALVVTPGLDVVAPNQLAYLGRMGPYHILKRVTGDKKDEIVLLSDTDVRSITLR